MQRKNAETGRDQVSMRELKARASEIIRRLEQTPDHEIIITRHGKPCAKLVSLAGKAEGIPWSERISLRNTWSHLHLEPSEEDFAEAKRIWEPKAAEVKRILEPESDI